MNMSTAGNSKTRNLTQQRTDGTKLPVPGWDRIYNALDSILLSLRISPPCQPGINNIKRLIISYRFMKYET